MLKRKNMTEEKADNKVFLTIDGIIMEVIPLKGISGFSKVKFSNQNNLERVKSFLVHKFGSKFISGQADKYFYITGDSLSSADLDSKEFFEFEEKSVSGNKSRLPSTPKNFINTESAPGECSDTWKDFFKSNGYEVTVESLNDVNGRFTKNKIIFLTIQEKRKFWNSMIRKRYKFSDSEPNSYIFTDREKP